jgi:hypothetical protein
MSYSFPRHQWCLPPRQAPWRQHRVPTPAPRPRPPRTAPAPRPPPLPHRRRRTLLWRCDGNLYGLQDAGAVFWCLARDWLLSLNKIDGITVTQSCVDPCIFSIQRETPHNDWTVQGLYVDDSLGAYSTDAVQAWFITQFTEFFEQSFDSGDDHPVFLAVSYTVSPDRSSVELNTPKLWKRLGARVAHLTLPTVRTVLPYNAMDIIFAPVSADNPLVASGVFDTRGILGVAGWGVQACRPGDIFAATLLARRAFKPTVSYVKCLTHFVAFLLLHADETIRYTLADGSLNLLKLYVDSSFANCPETMRSWFGFALFWNGCCFCWRSKLQTCVALSTRDSESIGTTFAVKDILGFLILLNECGFRPLLPVPAFVDNEATVASSRSEKVSRESRFMGMRLYWLREIVRAHLIDPRHIATDKNCADVFTKLLPGPAHHAHRAFLMGHTTWPYG